MVEEIICVFTSTVKSSTWCTFRCLTIIGFIQKFRDVKNLSAPSIATKKKSIIAQKCKNSIPLYYHRCFPSSIENHNYNMFSTVPYSWLLGILLSGPSTAFVALTWWISLLKLYIYQWAFYMKLKILGQQSCQSWCRRQTKRQQRGRIDNRIRCYCRLRLTVSKCAAALSGHKFSPVY